MSTKLGRCQVVFAIRQYDVEIDLVLAGAASVEGYALVPGSPLTVSVVPPAEPWARRRMMQLLRGWAADGAGCDAEIAFEDDQAILTICSGDERVAGAVTDLDVFFVSDLKERTEQ